MIEQLSDEPASHENWRSVAIKLPFALVVIAEACGILLLVAHQFPPKVNFYLLGAFVLLRVLASAAVHLCMRLVIKVSGANFSWPLRIVALRLGELFSPRETRLLKKLCDNRSYSILSVAGDVGIIFVPVVACSDHWIALLVGSAVYAILIRRTFDEFLKTWIGMFVCAVHVLPAGLWTFALGAVVFNALIYANRRLIRVLADTPKPPTEVGHIF